MDAWGAAPSGICTFEFEPLKAKLSRVWTVQGLVRPLLLVHVFVILVVTVARAEPGRVLRAEAQ